MLLLICIGRCLAQEAAFHAQQVVATNEDPIEHDPAEHEGAAAKEDVKINDDELRRQDEVREAVKILRKIRPPVVSKLAKYTRRPSGFVGSAVFYCKEAFTLLFLTSPIRSTPLTTTSTTQAAPPKLPLPLAQAVSTLEEVAKTADDPSDALFLLAEMNFHGNFTHPISYPRAFDLYKRLADEQGNSTAQHMIGFMYSTGLNPDAGQDQAKSMLYHNFAAEQDDTRSQMTLAYRHHAGISTSRDCEKAVELYQQVAVKAINYYRAGPPGGRSLIRQAYRIADDLGGVYGEGASYSSAGHNARSGGPTSDAYADVDDVLEYLHFQSSKGDFKATFGLARLHYDGGRGVKRDVRLAKQYFMEIARLQWDRQGKVRSDAPAGNEKLASKAAGYLGRMFLRGEGIDQSFGKAKIWFQRGISNGDALSQYSLGLMYLDGLGVDINVEKAADLLAAAADQDLAVAQTNLGILFLDQGDVNTASKYFELAARNSHIEAFFYLAELSNNGIGRERSCGNAAVYYKIVAEKAEQIWSSFIEANDAYEDGDQQKALVGYMMAAEQGSESAQANVAWILDQSPSKWSVISWLSSTARSITTLPEQANLALRYWTRSAKQSNLDSLVKMGDYYLLGLGFSTTNGLPTSQADHAAACYQAAAETLQSAQAMWNLGWMHENGIGGVEQDFHLAKRFYDQALETNAEAYLPVKLSLFKLRWRSWWNRVTYGSVKSIQDDGEPRKRRTFAEWVVEFLEADARQAYEEMQMAEADDWENGRDQMPSGDEYWEGGEELEDDVLVTLMIGGLIALLAWLIWYRQQRLRAAEQQRRDGVPQPAQPNADQAGDADRGVFPPPGDPAWNQWVAGGVGH